jgi:serine/threonine protein kinase/Flp pilus assembly protein TadD
MSKLPNPDPGSAPLVGTIRTPVVALLDDQNQRWQQGFPMPIENYLEREGWLRSDPEALLDLIYNEIRLRAEESESLDLDEYRRRFPELDEALGVQIEVHRAMERGRLFADISLGDQADVTLPPSTPLPAIDGYEVLDELGRGAMGVVYRARHVRLNRQVAIKMILAGVHAGERERARFETEARAVARLQHPYIVQIYEIGEQENRSFLCLELVRGGNLAEKLGGKPLPPLQAAQLAEALSRAVQYAHEQQIVHRDLKPANVLLADSDSRRGIRLGCEGEETYCEPKISDFGLARLLDQEGESASGATGGPVGTPAYMAPEQATRSSNKPYGTIAGSGQSTDVYSLGAILYEMLTGRPPFLATTVYETLQQVISLDPVPPRRLQPRVPRDLETICLACLRKEPQHRYASAGDLANDLRRFLDGKPIRQRPPAFWEPALKWARRRPAAAAWVVLGTAALFALFAGLGYSLLHRQEWARQRARDRYEQFVRYRDEAIFQGTLLRATRLESNDQAAVDRQATVEAASKALALAGMAVEEVRGPQLDPYLNAAEQADISSSCYELLLILSQVVEPLPANAADSQRQPATRGLRILDRASRFAPTSRAFHLYRARLLAQQGDASGASEERRLAEALPPVSASDCYLTGVERFRMADTQGAVRLFREALRKQADHFEARLHLALCSLRAGALEEAQSGLTACIAQRPGFAWAYLMRGVAGPKNAVAEAEEDFTTALALDDSASLRYVIYLGRGRMALREEKFADAIVHLEQAAQLQPDELPAHLLLARAFERLKRRAEADREIDKALALRPDLPVVQRERAEMFRDREEWTAALGHLQKAIQLTPAGSASPLLAADHIECGGIYFKLRRFTDALVAYDAALRIAHDHALAHHLRGETLLKLNRLQEAERAFDQSLRLQPGYDPALRARASTRERQGNFAGAIEDYTKALSGNRDSSALSQRGWAYTFMEAWKLALRDFDEAIRLDPRPGDAHIGRGLTRVWLGDYRQGVVDVDVVLRAGKPRTPEMMHNAACVYALAAGRVQARTSETGSEALAAAYRSKAIAALRKAVQLVSQDQRLVFWQQNMRPDIALDAIRGSAEFMALDRELKDASHTREKEKGKFEAR